MNQEHDDDAAAQIATAVSRKPRRQAFLTP
jgi:hypothetical protein